ncbi:unnamed protein product [Mytilus edulis]|uniref:DNA2/NAM7 helicase helicase domain-containing protein n=1 Tax=Mytilus edulis TaxID=6550 RepID=A0A8S3QIA5_MYTED|nr:unnamed protein product [Mytilus edulis]
MDTDRLTAYLSICSRELDTFLFKQAVIDQMALFLQVMSKVCESKHHSFVQKALNPLKERRFFERQDIKNIICELCLQFNQEDIHMVKKLLVLIKGLVCHVNCEPSDLMHTFDSLKRCVHEKVNDRNQQRDLESLLQEIKDKWDHPEKTPMTENKLSTLSILPDLTEIASCESIIIDSDFSTEESYLKRLFMVHRQDFYATVEDNNDQDLRNDGFDISCLNQGHDVKKIDISNDANWPDAKTLNMDDSQHRALITSMKRNSGKSSLIRWLKIESITRQVVTTQNKYCKAIDGDYDLESNDKTYRFNNRSRRDGEEDIQSSGKFQPLDMENLKMVFSSDIIFTNEKIKEKLHHTEQLTTEEANSVSNLWIDTKAAQQLYAEKQQEADIIILKKARLIACTTTRAARDKDILKKVSPSIFLIEEAAEIPEHHVVACLTSSCRQLIMIGDHQQLRPSYNDYKTAQEHKINISLFERLIDEGFPSTQLEYQHRMRPSISKLLVPHIYENLKNDTNVSGYENVKGIHCDMFLNSHSVFEDQDHNTISKSHKNRFRSIVHFVNCTDQVRLLRDSIGKVDEELSRTNAWFSSEQSYRGFLQKKIQVKARCGHEVQVECSTKYDASCKLQCSGILNCGHKCKGTHSECSQGRLHVPCYANCERNLVYEHDHKDHCSYRRSSCMNDDTCKTRVDGSKLCKEECKAECPNKFKCDKSCMATCERPKCNTLCMTRLECGPDHTCSGLLCECVQCICQICERLTNIQVEDKRVENAVYIRLEDCKCVFEVKVLDKHILNVMNNHNDETKSLKCPKCGTIIFKSRRYRKELKIINECMTDEFQNIRKIEESTYLQAKRFATRQLLTEYKIDIPRNIFTSLWNRVKSTKSIDILNMVIDQLTFYEEIFSLRIEIFPSSAYIKPG